MPQPGLARYAESQPLLRERLREDSLKYFFVVILIFVCCFAGMWKIKAESDADSTLAAGLRSTEIFLST